MSNLASVLQSNSISWLLEVDPVNPGVRYFALTDLLERSTNDPGVIAAQQAVMKSGPVPVILDAQSPEGYWVKPGAGYTPSYRATIWQIIFLAELGADPADERVRLGCDYVLDHSLAANGGFAMSLRPVPSSVVHCLNGDLLWALGKLGYAADPRLGKAVNWETSATIGDSDFRYYKSGTTGPGFGCVANASLPCAWGATKAMKGLLATRPTKWTPTVASAIEAGVDLLLSRDLAVADYPCADRISASWFKFGFPLSYRSDVLETAAVLGALGHGHDPRLTNTQDLILSKQDDEGRWMLERTLNGKMWIDIEEKGKPSKWVTLRALRVLKYMEESR